MFLKENWELAKNAAALVVCGFVVLLLLQLGLNWFFDLNLTLPVFIGCALLFLGGLFVIAVLICEVIVRRFKLFAICVACLVGLPAIVLLASHLLTPTPLQAAERTRIQIDRNEKAIQELTSQLKNDLTTVQPNFAANLDISVETIKDTVTGLRRDMDGLLWRHEKYVQANRALKTALDKAPNTFRNVAAQFASYANAESYSEIRNDYLQLSETWSALAERAERRARELQTQDPELDQSVDYLKHTALFLARLQAAVDSYPTTLKVGDVRERFLAQVKTFVHEYEAFRSHLRQWHDATVKSGGTR